MASGNSRRGGWREVDGSNGHRGDAFLAPDESHAFVGGRFNPHLFNPDLQGGSDVFLHRGYVRIDLGLLRDDGGIHIHQGTASGTDGVRRFLKEDSTGRATPPGIGIREKVAYIGLADGAED